MSLSRVDSQAQEPRAITPVGRKLFYIYYSLDSKGFLLKEYITLTSVLPEGSNFSTGHRYLA
jgi:hypothetical protein